MAETGPGAAGGYVAFISYSHKDAAVGRWLHRKLEGYRLPKRLAGTQGEDGEVPTRLTPIFRDRDELPAAGDLSERVRAALAASRNLIVVCSPSSAASPWVAKEIATFRELHPDRPIFTAIVEGEPAQCFSPALVESGAEPLAADLRKAGDGRRLGQLKLVAGLAGVGLDALVQRDAARRVRQVTYVTAAAVAAMLVMALLTVFALNARAEAQRERAQAEGLIEFMITDLRTKLEGVGRLDVMEAVNDRAIAYYDDAARRQSDQSLEQRARILHARGEDAVKQGKLDTALLWFREAHMTTAAILARRPKAADAIFAHGQSQFWIGRVHELREEWPRAGIHYERYAEAASDLIAIQPGNPDYMLEMGWGAMNRGVVKLHGESDPAAAQALFGEAILWFGRVTSRRQGDAAALRELANAYASLAESYYVRKLFRPALAAYRRQLEITRRINRIDPENREDVFRLAIAERAVAKLSSLVGEENGATDLLRQSYRRTACLSARDPANVEWRQFKAKIEADLHASGVGQTGLRATACD
ncbi:MAG TPA: TIR domain-containing protein [Allosphingosinicella sp.]|nr:TIR domain-containing protein [Allosphingosinicella sp.]